MTDFKVTDEAVFAAARALCTINSEVCGVNEQDNWNLYSDNFKNDARAAIEAALPVMFERVGKVCMNGSRYGHGLFADIEVQYDEPQSPAPNIGSDLYIIKEPK